MQAAKDSFLMALCARLQQVNPQRTVVIDGEVRPGVIAAENEPSVYAAPPEAFCVEWGEARPVSAGPSGPHTLMSVDVVIRYRTGGSSQGECDRGRSLTEMDKELMALLAPAQTAKLDYTQSTPASLGSNVFWKPAALAGSVQSATMFGRTATTTMYFYPEQAA